LQKLFFAWLISLAAAPCSAASVTSGDYDGLLVGVDRQGSLTAYFESATGNGQFSCVFFVSGKVKSRTFRVDTWFPADRNPKEVISGVIDEVTVSGKPAIRLTLEDEHGGCWNVQRFASEPASLTLDEQGSWEAIRVVAAGKAYFYDDTSRAHPCRAYVVRGNPLRVFETRTGWVRAEYVSPERKRTSGWILERDLFSPASPATEQQGKGRRP